MDFKKLLETVRELSSRGFYGTLEIEFKNGRPYLGIRSEKILFERQTYKPAEPPKPAAK